MLRRHSRLFLAAAATLLLAGTAAAVKAKESSITFLSPSQNWSVIPSSDPLPYGSTASIVYDTERLTGCRGTIDGTQPGWTITGYYQFNGGPVQSFWVAGFSSEPFPPAPAIALDTRGDLAVWFENTNLWGCQAWDSDFGNNFHFTVQ